MKDHIKSRTASNKKASARGHSPKKNQENYQKKKEAQKHSQLASVQGKGKKSSKTREIDRKSAALAALDDLLSKPGASSAGSPLPAPSVKLEWPNSSKEEAKSAHRENRDVTGDPMSSRFDRCLNRAQKGEPGPIKLSDLSLDPKIMEAVQKTGKIEAYKKMLELSPSAQPGRPLVNILGTSDLDLRFQLLTLYELVLAAMELGRTQLQVSLVRLTDVEASALLKLSPDSQVSPNPSSLSPIDVAKVNGFLELNIESIRRDENLRQHIDHTSDDFRNLMESIRTIGLQNPPVVEVRREPDDNHIFVCVSGHRRLLAMEKLGAKTVTCALKLFESDKHRALAGLAENINREDLHFLDKADGYGLLSREGMTSSEIAALLDADTRTVGKYLRAAEWDNSVKSRIRGLGSKATTRFLLNALAAGERTTSELHAMIDRFIKSAESPAIKMKPPSGVELKRKLSEFCTLAGYGQEEQILIEKALRYLGFMS